MSDLTHQRIPGLGQVALRAISVGDVSDAEEQADLVEEADRASTFTNYLLSSVIIEPPYTSEDVASLSDDIVIDLIRAAIDTPELRDNFNDLPASIPPRERFHQAYAAFLRAMFEKIDFTPLFTELNNSIQRIIDETLTHISDNIIESQHIIEQAFSAINEHFASQRQEIQRIFNSFGDIFRRSLEDARMASQAAGSPLTQAGFWMPPSAPIYLLTAIKLLVDRGEATPENVRQFIIDCFDQRDYYHLKHMVENWRSKSFFADRMQVIEDALGAHIDGKYTLSIPVLLPLEAV